MPLPRAWDGRLAAPVVAAPLFLASGPDLVVETCRAGLVGTFPALNCRRTEDYEGWLAEIGERLRPHASAAPFGVNLVVHRSNGRLADDLAGTVRHRVPFVVTSLGASAEIVEAVHGYGGTVFHDAVGLPHARKAIGAGVDGIVAVCAGAGGHAGTLSPFALVSELRRVFDGTIAVAGALSDGRQVAAARLLGADLAYMGTRFLATRESLAAVAHREMIVASRAEDVVLTAAVSGVPASFLKESLLRSGLDPNGRRETPGGLDATDAKAWRDVWSAGQGVGSIDDIPTAAELARRLIAEYRDALLEASALACAAGRGG